MNEIRVKLEPYDVLQEIMAILALTDDRILPLNIVSSSMKEIKLEQAALDNALIITLASSSSNFLLHLF